MRSGCWSLQRPRWLVCHLGLCSHEYKFADAKLFSMRMKLEQRATWGLRTSTLKTRAMSSHCVCCELRRHPSNFSPRRVNYLYFCWKFPCCLPALIWEWYRMANAGKTFVQREQTTLLCNACKLLMSPRLQNCKTKNSVEIYCTGCPGFWPTGRNDKCCGKANSEISFGGGFTAVLYRNKLFQPNQPRRVSVYQLLNETKGFHERDIFPLYPSGIYHHTLSLLFKSSPITIIYHLRNIK